MYKNNGSIKTLWKNARFYVKACLRRRRKNSEVCSLISNGCMYESIWTIIIIKHVSRQLCLCFIAYLAGLLLIALLSCPLCFLRVTDWAISSYHNVHTYKKKCKRGRRILLPKIFCPAATLEECTHFSIKKEMIWLCGGKRYGKKLAINILFMYARL